jgi:hypothetical protein
MHALTEMLVVSESTAQAQWPLPQKLTGLMQQAGQVLSDMRRECESAADALVSIAVALDGDLDALDAPAAQTNNSAQLQLCGLPKLDASRLSPLLGYPSVRPGGLSPLDAGLLAAGAEVGVEEKVEWLHRAIDAAGNGPSHKAVSAQASSPCGV